MWLLRVYCFEALDRILTIFTEMGVDFGRFHEDFNGEALARPAKVIVLFTV